MIVQLFGLLDIIAALSVVLLKFDIFIWLSLVLGIYLIIKSLIFIKSLASWIDLICGIGMIISFIGFFSGFSWLVLIWLIQKGIFSLIKF